MSDRSSVRFSVKFAYRENPDRFDVTTLNESPQKELKWYYFSHTSLQSIITEIGTHKLYVCASSRIIVLNLEIKIPSKHVNGITCFTLLRVCRIGLERDITLIGWFLIPSFLLHSVHALTFTSSVFIHLVSCLGGGGGGQLGYIIYDVSQNNNGSINIL